MNLDTLLRLFARCELTPHHAATEVALFVTKDNVDEIMRSLPQLLRDALQDFVADYRPGRMLSNYGEAHIPSPESVDCIKEWFADNE
jgi:hypothetical protein